MAAPVVTSRKGLPCNQSQAEARGEGDTRRGASSILPGPVPTELVVGSTNSIGKKLLQTMGWREGQGVGSRRARKARRRRKKQQQAAVAQATASSSASSSSSSRAVASAGGGVDEEDDEEDDPHASGFLFARKNAAVIKVEHKNNM